LKLLCTSVSSKSSTRHFRPRRCGTGGGSSHAPCFAGVGGGPGRGISGGGGWGGTTISCVSGFCSSGSTTAGASAMATSCNSSVVVSWLEGSSSIASSFASFLSSTGATSGTATNCKGGSRRGAEISPVGSGKGCTGCTAAASSGGGGEIVKSSVFSSRVFDSTGVDSAADGVTGVTGVAFSTVGCRKEAGGCLGSAFFAGRSGSSLSGTDELQQFRMAKNLDGALGFRSTLASSGWSFLAFCSFRCDRRLLDSLGSLRRLVRLVREFAMVTDSSCTVSVVISEDWFLLPLEDEREVTRKSERFFFGCAGKAVKLF
jgi:hypothetical protein